MNPLDRLRQQQVAPDFNVQVQEQVFNRVNRLKSMLPLLRASGRSQLRKLANKIEGFVAPIEGAFKISQRFGNVSNLYKGVTQGSRHQGLDVATPLGTQVRAPVAGRVMRGYDPRGYGDYVRVISPDGMTYQFSHLSNVADLPDQVQAGQVLGATGGVGARRGRSTGAHLDIGVQKGGKWIDPLTVEPLRRALNG